MTWSHNLSLSHQVGVQGSWGYRWMNQEDAAAERATFEVSGNHLWSLADRYLLETQLRYALANSIEAERRLQDVAWSSSLNVYFEDQVSLLATVGAHYDGNRVFTDEYTGWSWSYQLGLTYKLDRLFS